MPNRIPNLPAAILFDMDGTLTEPMLDFAAIKAGEYRIPAHLSASDVLKLLQGGKTLQRMVTIPEGWPSVLVAQAIMKADGMTGKVSPPIEGTVLPDSYAYDRGQPRQALAFHLLMTQQQARLQRAGHPREIPLMGGDVALQARAQAARRMVKALAGEGQQIFLPWKARARQPLAAVLDHAAGMP